MFHSPPRPSRYPQHIFLATPLGPQNTLGKVSPSPHSGPLSWIVHPGPHNTLSKISPSPYSGPYDGIISHSPHSGPLNIQSPLPWIIHPGPHNTLGTFSRPPLPHLGPHGALGPTATCWDVSLTILLGTFLLRLLLFLQCTLPLLTFFFHL